MIMGVIVAATPQPAGRTGLKLCAKILDARVGAPASIPSGLALPFWLRGTT
jgi:hypothetical protein